ncbi:four helix bundle protein [Winogradskyella sp. 3972H.M.0a.05]|uniref:four helix bundle protein n=1 Tax=Winogradskyella sp. 3972H.M.0a.05 TaxID=2950277 RepID=UPI0033919FBB
MKESRFKFENLHIWSKAMDLGEDVNALIDNFPKKENYNLSSQMLRAVDSIALNISEGSIGQSISEFNKFIGYAIRSLAEVVTCLHKAIRRKYITQQDFKVFYDESFHLMNMMIAFRNKINQSSDIKHQASNN